MVLEVMEVELPNPPTPWTGVLGYFGWDLNLGTWNPWCTWNPGSWVPGILGPGSWVLGPGSRTWV